MKIAIGPFARTRPGWNLKRKHVAALVPTGPEGRPNVLAAQILVNAALQGARVLMLLPVARSEDETWKALVAMLTDDNDKSAAEAMSDLPISMHTHGTGWDRAERADLVYAPGLSAREMRRLSEQTEAPILVVGKDLHRQSPDRPVEVIRVGSSSLQIDSEGCEIPVVYDPSGPIYRPA